ncbi:MAG TPA: hypothetical protein VFX70_02910 [Mycobacteriales bacterium]|nr:hypothetical protein [Mycobacteriales bacterium]
MVIPQIGCHADGGCYVALAGSPAATALAAMAALRRPHDPVALGSPSGADVAELVQAAAEHALAAGWVQRVDGFWLCPAHAGTYLDREPHPFTIRECLYRHRHRQPDVPPNHLG